MALHKKYRSYFEIVALMLEATKESDTTRYLIMKRAGVNCKEARKYSQSLVEIGFIEVCVEEGRMLYKASEKGLDFLRQYYVLLGLLLNNCASKDATSVSRRPGPQILAPLQSNHWKA